MKYNFRLIYICFISIKNIIFVPKMSENTEIINYHRKACFVYEINYRLIFLFYYEMRRNIVMIILITV